jgi:hypothetical protein
VAGVAVVGRGWPLEEAADDALAEGVAVASERSLRRWALARQSGFGDNTA